MLAVRTGSDPEPVIEIYENYVNYLNLESISGQCLPSDSGKFILLVLGIVLK